MQIRHYFESKNVNNFLSRKVDIIHFLQGKFEFFPYFLNNMSIGHGLNDRNYKCHRYPINFHNTIICMSVKHIFFDAVDTQKISFVLKV